MTDDLEPVELSIIIPIRNEAENIVNLIYELIAVFKDENEFEIILVDDASIDSTDRIIKENFADNDQLKFFVLPEHKGQSAALLKGINEASGRIIGTLDGDGQNPPAELLRLYKILLKDKSLKMVSGVREKRRDSFYKKIISWQAKVIRSLILQDNCSDIACALKVFYKKEFESISFSGNFHRVLPYLFKLYGYKTKEENVSHRERLKGCSKYGMWNRIPASLRDLKELNDLRKKL